MIGAFARTRRDGSHQRAGANKGAKNPTFTTATIFLIWSILS